MQIGKITFNDEHEIKLAIHGAKHYFFILELDRELRDWLKYENHKFKTPEEVMEAIRKMIHEEVNMELVP